MQALVDSNKKLTINGDKANLTFDTAALKEILVATKGEVVVSITATDLNKYKDTMLTFGTRPILDISIGYKSGEKIVLVPLSFSNGKASVELRYIPAQDELIGGLSAVYLDSAGKTTYITNSGYDSAAKAVKFVTTHFSVYGIGYKPVPNFSDITGHWAETDIQYVATQSIMSGTGNQRFEPERQMTRSMFITTHGRVAGADISNFKSSSFNDVAENSYYAKYIAWAAENGLVTGTSSRYFHPDRPITREEVAAILTRYINIKQYSFDKKEAMPVTDSTSISPWAMDACIGMVETGLMALDSNGMFEPSSRVTRADAANLWHRFNLITSQ